MLRNADLCVVIARVAIEKDFVLTLRDVPNFASQALPQRSVVLKCGRSAVNLGG